MPTFKQKNTTLKNAKANKPFVSLDTKHTAFLKEFHINKMEIIPKLKQDRADLRNQLKRLNQSPNANIGDIIDKRLQLEEQIETVTNKIKELLKKEHDYFKTNAKLVFDYFENKKNIENMASSGTVNTSANSKINSFFQIENKGDATTEINKIKQNQDSVTKYLFNVDDALIDVSKYMSSPDVCTLCAKNGELIPFEEEGIVVCNQCYHIFPYLIENEKPTYKETPKEITFYAYKRLNHFKEVMAQFQAKETTLIHSDVIEKIETQIKRERIDLKKLSNDVMRTILNKLGYDSKYYEHIPYIKHRLGINPIVISRELEEALNNDFNELQRPYFKHCPEHRENFLNYNYTAFKLCERRGHYNLLKYFNKIKDPTKLTEHDQIWKKICAELDWVYKPTDYDAYEDVE
jgi:hypothetical protein